jgi:hypothetical protein
MYIGLHAKYPLLLSHFNRTWNFLDRFSKNIHIPNFMNIRLVGAVVPCGRTYGQMRRSYYSLFAILRTRLKTIIHAGNFGHLKESQLVCQILSCWPQRPHGIKGVMSSTLRTLISWVRIPLGVRICGQRLSVPVLASAGWGLAMGRYLNQRSPTKCLRRQTSKFREGLYRVCMLWRIHQLQPVSIISSCDRQGLLKRKFSLRVHS